MACDSLYGQNILGADAQILQLVRVELINSWETLSILPEELDQSQLREYTNDICCALLSNQHPVYSTSKHLNRFSQVCRARQCDQRLLLATHFFHVLERDRLSFSSLLRELVKGGYVTFVRMCETDNEEEICIEVAVIECACSVACVCVFTKQDNIGRSVLDQNLASSASHLDTSQTIAAYTRSILDTGVVLYEPYKRTVHDFSKPNRLPVAALEPGITALGGRIVE